MNDPERDGLSRVRLTELSGLGPERKEHMRTDDEILARIEAVKAEDWMGTQISDLIVRLPFAKAQPYLKPEATEDDWKVMPRDRESVLAEMLDYMPFAWDKANNERGLSAGRSMDHYSAWVWLAGDDLGDLREYQFYGKDNLRRICAHYGWDADQWDDGRRVNTSE